MVDNLPSEKMSIIVQDRHFDKVHFAFVIASGASAIGRSTTMFFTMGACQVLLAKNPDGSPGWTKMPLSGNCGSGADQDIDYKKRGIATFEELLDACKNFDVKFMVCEMGLRAMNIDYSSLRKDLKIESAGVVSFLNDSSKDGSMLFI